MAKNFNSMVKRFDKELTKNNGRFKRSSQNENTRSSEDWSDGKKNMQCHECEGYVHFKSDCPFGAAYQW